MDILTGNWRTDCGHTYLATGNGKVYSLRSLPDGSYLRLKNSNGNAEQEYFTPGKHSCHINLIPGKAILSDYSSGSLTVFHLDDKGVPEGSPDVKYFGGQSRIHSSWISPSDGLLVVVDHGKDIIYRCNPCDDAFPFNNYEEFEMPKGSAPRHCAFDKSGNRLYVSTEYSDEVLILDYPSMKILQQCPVNPSKPKGGAHIAISHNGQFLYVSSRFFNDGIAIFEINKEGCLDAVGYKTTGLNPRHFSISDDDSILAVACKDSDRVEFYGIDKETGLLSQSEESVSSEKPVFVIFP